MWKKRLSIGFVAISSAIAVEVNKFLIASGINVFYALLSSVLFAAVAQRCFEFVFFELPLRYSQTRQLIDPVARVEGYWFEEVSAQEHPFSYACIEYDKDSGNYNYYGSNYTPQCDLNATFKSTNVQIMRENNTIHFQFNATVYKTRKLGDTITGYGDISFVSDGSGKLNRGDGRFIDNTGTEIRQRKLLLTRIPTKTIKKILGKRHIESQADVEKLIEQVSHQYKCLKSQVNPP